jgi:Niemann-Pick C1 protein
VYYEQYGYIRGVALSSFLVALSAVFLASFLVTNEQVAATTALLVASITICLLGWVWALNPHPYPAPTHSPDGGPYGVSINAVSVVNGITALGMGVEFLVHVASAYFGLVEEEEGKGSGTGLGEGAAAFCSRQARQTRLRRARTALVRMGSPVVTGITLTKLVGVLVLSTAPSQLFRLYYFRMYLGIIVLGAFHGLALLPALLAC